MVLALLFARIGALCMVLPGAGETEVPAPVRLSLALALTALLAPVLGPRIAVPGDAMRLLVLLAGELVVGVFLGLLVRALVWALMVAGQYAALLIGLSNVFVPDPALGAHGTALARLFALAGAMLVLSTGLWRGVLAALAGSYDLFTPGAALPAEGLAETMLSAVARSLALAVQLAGPLVLAALLANLALGLLGRLAPQMPVFFVAQPAMPMLGLLLLALVVAPLLSAWVAAAADILAALAPAR
ncbi:MAG: flagellar biosynthetic protein FliR [Alphaproteobacteria bacterium]|nr:flagellar biosynthetic protein FliR [Alphaproteobacteria bacterium]